MRSTAENKTNNSKGPLNVLANLGDFTPKKTRQIICKQSVSKRDEEGIVEFYEAMVPRKELSFMDLNSIHKFFPTFDDIDIQMIIEEGFPKFEETIGVQNFAKVKKYFGIGCNAKKNQNNLKEINDLLSKLRTIENAQYYICGFKELISKLANLLEDGEEYTDIEKAKIIRMHSVLLFGYCFFVEDFVCIGTGESKRISIDYTKVERNNKRGFYPEELFVLYMSKFIETPEKSVFYDSICFELSQVEDRKLVNEILNFSELNLKNGKFISVNEANPYQTFGKIRGIKSKIHKEPEVYPMEFFSVKSMTEKFDLGGLYSMYKILKTHQLEELKKVEQDFVKFEGSRIYKSKHICYEVLPENYICGEFERKRFIRLVEILSSKGLTMYLRNSLKTQEKFKKPRKYNMGQFMGAIEFVNEANLVKETSVQRDFEIANMLIKMDKGDILSKYLSGEITIEEVKSKLKIDEAFEFEFFGIKPKIEYKDVISNFALQNGYVGSKEEIDIELVENVIIPGNEELIEQYNSGELDEKKFKKKLGLISGFSEMFFKLSSVDISAIEERLLEVKKSTVGKKKFDHSLKMLVLLYCYIVEGQIACGPKNHVPKRNKALKPSNLKTLI